ncbi:MAG: hypothetical protein UW41_C0016G0036 [Candidatus Collierbacteria bacterium GW2011_GWC2_44_18]|uniref:Uncharacterized protein n=1 Tax=Candidatus Collierbacteria bacterium GW2011_GWC2_44_18 TaxID=1618392 RepID=A0A0G1KLR3_9BACT|nr:MAG: hypothetical protein UW41_C0016G0036 [Candidatus Collierbacteria bacterium GW2011_GWC2_44_18]
MSNPAYQQVAKVIVDKAGNLSEAERKALRGLLDGFDGQPQLSFPCYTVTVDYSASVEQMIKAGKFDWFNDDVTSRHFPSNEKGVAEVLVYLVNFNRDISSEDAVKELDRQGLRPATLRELLALGVAQPDLQRNNPIVRRPWVVSFPLPRLVGWWLAFGLAVCRCPQVSHLEP